MVTVFRGIESIIENAGKLADVKARIDELSKQLKVGEQLIQVQICAHYDLTLGAYITVNHGGAENRYGRLLDAAVIDGVISIKFISQMETWSRWYPVDLLVRG